MTLEGTPNKLDQTEVCSLDLVRVQDTYRGSISKWRLQQIIAECQICHPRSFLRITRPGEFDNHAKVDSSESSLQYKCAPARGEAKPGTFRRSSFHFRTHQQLCGVCMPVWRASNPYSHVPRSTLIGKGMHFTTRLSDDCGMAVL